MIQQKVGNYLLESLLGSGGMGEVYKAYDARRGRYVALKLLPAAFSGDMEYAKRFQRESYVAARLTEPHVIPIHDFGEIDGQLFIDMRMVEGTDIGALLAASGRIPPQQAVYFVSQIAQALDAAHADGLVHRDIKPSNILVTPNDFVYVVDFGIARSMGGFQTALTITGATIGTLHYMAPERFIGHDVDGRADVYSLACLLHECLTGAPPFGGKEFAALMYAHLQSDAPPASRLVPGVPPALDAVIAGGMAKNPDERFPTAGALAAAARQALLTGAPPPPPPMTELPTPTWTDQPSPTATRRDVPVFTSWQGAPVPPGRGAEPAVSPYEMHSPTQTVLASGNWGGTRPPEYTPPFTSSDPGGGYRPPSGATSAPARRPGSRRLGLLIPAVVAALAVPAAIIFIAVNRSHVGGNLASAGDNTRASAGTAGPAGGASPLALPKSAGTIRIGQAPSYVQVAPNGKFAYVTNPGAGTITVLNTATDQVSGTVAIPEGPPQFVSFSRDSQTAYVSVYKTNGSVHLIAFVDTATGAVTGTVPVNNFTPTESVPSPDGRFLYVPNHNTAMSGTNQNVVDVIDIAAKKLLTGIPVQPNPHWVVFSKDGRVLYTTDHMSADVTVVNAQTNAVITNIEVGETPHSEAISPDGTRLAVTSYDGNVVYLINTATNKEITRIPVGDEPVNIAYSPDGRYLLTVNTLSNTVTVINTANNRVIGQIRTGKEPTSISVLPNGRQAYVTDSGDGTVEILNFPK
jgi:YVTN family beta-propeller protein